MLGFISIFLFCLISVVTFFLGIFPSPITPYGWLPAFLLWLWGRVTVLVTFTRLEITGAENLPDRGPVVFTANHQSLMDIPVLFSIIKIPVRMMAKKSLLIVPIIGWALYVFHFITVERDNPKKALKSLYAAAEIIKKGVSVLLFAEGTRGDGGDLLPFKSGPFLLAIKAGVPVVPIAIAGTVNIHNKKKPFFFGTFKQVRIIIDKPIDAKKYSVKEREKLCRQVEKVVSANYQKIK